MAVPCILITSKSFIHQQMHYILILENSKIYIKSYIKISPTCFGSRPSSGSLHLSLAKVTLTLCVLCSVQGQTRPAQNTVHTPYLDITYCHNTV
jgi:hypothetical protein